MDFQVIAGLGNPGAKYEHTRHNVGFLLLDHLAQKQNVAWRGRFSSEMCELKFADRKILGVKPQTFMNRSGEAVKEVVDFFKVEPQQLVVCYDEVDLPLGSIRIKQGGGAAGHNGIKSLISQLTTPEFVRLRLGIGRPQRIDQDDKVVPVETAEGQLANWVLGSFSKDERLVVEQMIERAAAALPILLEKGVKAAQNVFN